MANLLYLVHRLPFPPNKGDKVRSYHLLKHLTARHRVFLGAFVDDPNDYQYIETVRSLCPDLHVTPLHPHHAKLRSLTGLLTHQALSLGYFHDADLKAWVRQICDHHKMDAAVVFSSAMAQYIDMLPQATCPPMVVDFVDVDSAKWTQYAERHRWPLSWLYRREGQRLLAYERDVAVRSKKSFFVSCHEAALFVKMAPECSDSIQTLCNGVDTQYFSPEATRSSPFVKDPLAGEVIPIVFTGAMDYWPNSDAVTWFARAILPVLLKNTPHLCFYIVGRNPPHTVQALASDTVVVTGTVPDVRPYLQFATIVVAPLRVARGIQNKVLEAMAMARPVVASRLCAAAIDAFEGEEYACAGTEAEFVAVIEGLLGAPSAATQMGRLARARMIKHCSWPAHLSAIDRYLIAKPVAGDWA